MRKLTPVGLYCKYKLARSTNHSNSLTGHCVWLRPTKLYPPEDSNFEILALYCHFSFTTECFLSGLLICSQGFCGALLAPQRYSRQNPCHKRFLCI